MAIERLCPQCAETHKVIRNTKIYCSALCRQKALLAKKRLALSEQQLETTILSNTEKQK